MARPTLSSLGASTRARFAFSRRRLAGQRLAVIWSVVFFLGVVLIVSRKDENVATLKGALAPCALILFYCLAGLATKEKNTGKFADSLYFMGFLWTLAALIDAVVAETETMKVNTVFRAFGYSLTTTGFGMFLRVMVLQYQATLPDQLQETQKSIEQNLTGLIESLVGAAKAADTIRDAIVARASPEVDQLGEIITKFRTRLEVVATAAIDETAKILDKEFARARSRLTAELDLASDSTRDLRNTAEAISKLPAAIEKLEQAASAMTTASNSRVSAGLESLRESERAIGGAGTAARKLSEAVDDIVTLLKEELRSS